MAIFDSYTVVSSMTRFDSMGFNESPYSRLSLSEHNRKDGAATIAGEFSVQLHVAKPSHKLSLLNLLPLFLMFVK